MLLKFYFSPQMGPWNILHNSISRKLLLRRANAIWKKKDAFGEYEIYVAASKYCKILMDEREINYPLNKSEHGPLLFCNPQCGSSKFKCCTLLEYKILSDCISRHEVHMYRQAKKRQNWPGSKKDLCIGKRPSLTLIWKYLWGFFWHFRVNVNYWWLPGQVLAVFLMRFSEVVCYFLFPLGAENQWQAQGHREDFVSNSHLEFMLSWFLAWFLNQNGSPLYLYQYLSSFVPVYFAVAAYTFIRAGTKNSAKFFLLLV